MFLGEAVQSTTVMPFFARASICFGLKLPQGRRRSHSLLRESISFSSAARSSRMALMRVTAFSASTGAAEDFALLSSRASPARFTSARRRESAETSAVSVFAETTVCMIERSRNASRVRTLSESRHRSVIFFIGSIMLRSPGVFSWRFWSVRLQPYPYRRGRSEWRGYSPCIQES